MQICEYEYHDFTHTPSPPRDNHHPELKPTSWGIKTVSSINFSAASFCLCCIVLLFQKVFRFFGLFVNLYPPITNSYKCLQHVSKYAIINPPVCKGALAPSVGEGGELHIYYFWNITSVNHFSFVALLLHRFVKIIGSIWNGRIMEQVF